MTHGIKDCHSSSNWTTRWIHIKRYILISVRKFIFRFAASLRNIPELDHLRPATVTEPLSNCNCHRLQHRRDEWFAAIISEYAYRNRRGQCNLFIPGSRAGWQYFETVQQLAVMDLSLAVPLEGHYFAHFMNTDFAKIFTHAYLENFILVLTSLS